MTYIQSYHFESGHPGPTLLLLGAIHGNETAGPISLMSLIDTLESKTIDLKGGKIIIVPVCNPKANKQDVRFTEVNLNRVIKRNTAPHYYEEYLAQDIMDLIDQCDYMLDIHSTHVKDDPPFVFFDERIDDSRNFAEALGIATLFVGWENVYQGDDFSTEAYAGQFGKIGITLECGYHKDQQAVTIAETAIYNALRYLKMIGTDGSSVSLKKPQIYRFIDKVIYEDGDIFVKEWKHMDPVNKNTPLYKTKNNAVVTASQDGFVLIPNPAPHIGTEFYYFGILDE